MASWLSHPVLWATLIPWLAAQLIKIYLRSRKRGQLRLEAFTNTGGNPSAHSAAVSALTTALLITEGITSLSVAAGVFAIIVINDSWNLRRAVGEEGKTMNTIIHTLKLDVPFRKYAIGHTPLQVIMGIIVGVIGSWIVLAAMGVL